MLYNGTLEGRYVELRSVTEADAEFTLKLRQKPEVIKFIPALKNTLEQQKVWITSQQQKKGDYFFVIWNKKGERIGTISLYNIKGNTCEGGRLVVQGNAFESIEAQLLSFKFAFEELRLSEVVSYIYADNERAIRFNKQFGGVLFEPEPDEDGRMSRKTINTK